MSTKHTPGPWLTSEPNGRGNGWRAGPAWLGYDAHSERTAANARLIAASPNMLDALYEALEFAEDQEDVIDGNDGKPVANDAMRLAQTLRAAIAKATGEAA